LKKTLSSSDQKSDKGGKGLTKNRSEQHRNEEWEGPLPKGPKTKEQETISVHKTEGHPTIPRGWEGVFYGAVVKCDGTQKKKGEN